MSGLLASDFAPEYEPYDTPHTPRLDFDQLQRYVACLPDKALKLLSVGPVEEGCIECGVCHALEDLLPENPKESPEAMGKVTFSAYVLQEWHDSLSFSDKYNSTFEKRIIHPETYEYVQKEALQVLGSLMYARCCAIYSTATAELLKRKGK